MYPSSPKTLISRFLPINLSLGRNAVSVQQLPRDTQGNNKNSFGGTLPLTALPSVTQGIKRLPVITPGSFSTLFFRGK